MIWLKESLRLPFPKQEPDFSDNFPRRGIIVFFRSQKIIIIDRLGNRVVHALRDEKKTEKQLLHHEILANTILPHCTIPILFSHLEQQPFFLVQPYCPYTPLSYETITNSLLGDIFKSLFAFYDYYGLETLGIGEYMGQLTEKIESSLRDGGFEPKSESLSRLTGMIYRECSRASALSSESLLFLTQVHGDLIPHHIVRPNKSADSDFFLVDWSESYKYSIFHDLFYLQFQNYHTDFWEKFLSLNPDDLIQYYGEGWRTFYRLLQERKRINMDSHYVRLNFLICLLQELDHRLNRIHRRFLPFWISQVEKIWPRY